MTHITPISADSPQKPPPMGNWKGLIKVCGMRDAENIRDVENLGVDWIGFIFYPKSPRAVNRMPGYLPKNAKRVGVFVDELPENILETAMLFRLDLVQLHGNESPEFCDELAKNGLNIIKAFSIGNEFPSEKIERYEKRCDYFLFDTKTAHHGGSGRKFNWEILSEYRGETPFLLSGGISPDDADAVKAFTHEKCIGIDLNSRFETSPAQKDIHLLYEFIEKLQK